MYAGRDTFVYIIYRAMRVILVCVNILLRFYGCLVIH